MRSQTYLLIAAVLALSTSALAQPQSRAETATIGSEVAGTASTSTLRGARIAPETRRYTITLFCSGSDLGGFVAGREIAAVLAKGQEEGPNGERALAIALESEPSSRRVAETVLNEGANAVGIVDPAVLRGDSVWERQSTPKDRPVYIAKLFADEIHLLAGPGIDDIRDLSGKNVAAGPADSDAQLYARAIFARLDVSPRWLDIPNDTVLDNLRAGRIAAALVVGTKPLDPLTRLAQDSDIRLLALPFDSFVDSQFLPAVLSHADYPRLVPKDGAVETLAVSRVLIAKPARRWSGPQHLLQLFTRSFFDHLPELQRAPYHSKWREVNLRAALPGWQRARFAEDWLKDSAHSRLSDAPSKRSLKFPAAKPDGEPRPGSAEETATPDRVSNR
jgi:TRAP-type uncharacterized transport system substrate-binding protein